MPCILMIYMVQLTNKQNVNQMQLLGNEDTAKDSESNPASLVSMTSLTQLFVV